MKKQIFLSILIFCAFQLAIILLSLLSYGGISLLFYINISFYVGALFIFLALLFITVKSGFFDAMTKSLRTVFRGRQISKKEAEEMTLPSEIISFNFYPLLWHGLAIIAVMLIALYIYSF